MKRGGVGEGEGEQLPVGSAEGGGGDDEVLAAELWIPDPEERRGWLIYVVWKKKDKRRNGPAGFRRSGMKGDG